MNLEEEESETLNSPSFGGSTNRENDTLLSENSLKLFLNKQTLQSATKHSV